jgi:SpoVK/Ycf46/Vps4 family AAA+-type ATPase
MEQGLPYVVKDLSESSQAIIRVETQERFIAQMVNSMTFFFGRANDSFQDLYPLLEDSTNFPFKGFIFEGPPGSGKTEAVIDAGRRLAVSLGNQHSIEMRLFHVNSSNINTKGFGDSEQRLKQVFADANCNENKNVKTIILFDDIDSLLTKRDVLGAEEWTRSLNGVFFHELDNLITTKVMVIATTNLPDNIDDAVHSRLARRKAPAPTFDEMKQVAKSALPIRGAKGLTQEQLLEHTGEAIKLALENDVSPSFRLARQTAIETVLKYVTGWDSEGAL